MNEVLGQPKVAKGPRACATCAKAKSRCIAGPIPGGRCERCHRLEKPCSSQTPAPPRKRKEPKPTRVAELERRLEDLTARIENAQRQQNHIHNQSQSPNQPPSPAETVDREPPLSVSTGQRLQPPQRHDAHVDAQKSMLSLPNIFPVDAMQEPTRTPAWTGGTGSASTGSVSGGGSFGNPMRCIGEGVGLLSNRGDMFGSATDAMTAAQEEPSRSSSPERMWPEGGEADVLLQEYRAHLGALFPFTIVPPGMSSAQLQNQRPLFWKAIMVAACHMDGLRQMALGNMLLREVTEAAIIKPQKTLDLLQGLQLLIAWYHYNLSSFQTTNLLFLTRSICASLGFNESQTATREFDMSSTSLEQMRAFAGTYYLVTTTFTVNKKPDALMNTSYLEACCKVLENRMEYPTDELLVWLVRAQQLAQSISLTMALRNNQVADLPLSLVIKSFREQIETFKNSLPPHLQNNPSLVGNRYVAQLLLYEIGLVPNSGLPVPEQLEYLWCSAHATKALLAHRLSFPVADHPQFVAMTSNDFMYGFLTCLKLVTFNCPGWDLALVRRELAFGQILERHITDMGLLSERRKRRRRRRLGTGSGSGGRENRVRIGSGFPGFPARLPLGLESQGEGASSSSPGSGGGPETDLKGDGTATGGEGAEEGDEEEEDPFHKFATRLRSVLNIVGQELDGVYNITLSRAANSSPMTLKDIIQYVMQDLESDLWQDTINALDWNPFDTSSFSAQIANY